MFKYKDKVKSSHLRYKDWFGYVLGYKWGWPAVRFYEKDRWDLTLSLEKDLEKVGTIEEKLVDITNEAYFFKEGNFMPVQLRRPGIWANNGFPATSDLMLSWKPGAITSFVDYIDNALFKYKRENPGATIILRFQHDPAWRADPFCAVKMANQIISKWDDIKELDPYVYFGNEMNLHYENGDLDPANQHLYETKDFYQRLADFFRMTAIVVKNKIPEIKLVTPPMAFGHMEDGAPDEDGNPSDGWCGYQFMWKSIRDYFSNIVTFHGYWGNSGGCVPEWLYGPDNIWYAYRWKKVIKLFKKQWNQDIKILIDEAGNMQASHPDFTKQVLDYSQACLNDSRVIALTYFLWNDPTNSSGNVLNSWVQKCQNLSGHLEALKNFNLSSSTGDVVIPKSPSEDTNPPTEIINTDMSIQYADLRKGEMALMVGNYPKARITFKVSDPYGNTHNVVTGSKLEKGIPGGIEFGFSNLEGDYRVEGDGKVFIVPSKGNQLITLIFNQTTTETLVKWNSVPMAKITSDTLWARLSESERKLFSIQEVK